MSYTYKDIVNRFRSIVWDHRMIRDFGYGDLSDIKVKPQDPAGLQTASYPYAFLNPATHSRNQNSVIYRFNLIVMTMAGSDTSEYLQAQSDCQQYIDDIIAQFRFGYTDQMDIQVSYNLTPFKERFQDTLAGMTATIAVEVPVALNACIAPFAEYTELVWAKASGDQTVDPDAPENRQAFSFGTILVTDGNWQNSNRYEVPQPGQYKIIANLQIKLVEPTPGQILPRPLQLLTRKESPVVITYTPPFTIEGWPTAYVDSSTVYNVYAQWLVNVPSIGDLQWEFVVLEDLLGQEESSLINLQGSEIKVYRMV